MRRYFKAGIKILGLLGICTELSKSAWRSAAAVLTVRNIFWIENSRSFLQPQAQLVQVPMTVTAGDWSPWQHLYQTMCLDIFAEVGAVSSEQAGIKYVVGLVKFKLQLPGREGEGGGGPKTRTLYKYWPGRGGDTLRWPHHHHLVRMRWRWQEVGWEYLGFRSNCSRLGWLDYNSSS